MVSYIWSLTRYLHFLNIILSGPPSQVARTSSLADILDATKTNSLRCQLLTSGSPSRYNKSSHAKVQLPSASNSQHQKQRDSKGETAIYKPHPRERQFPSQRPCKEFCSHLADTLKARQPTNEGLSSNPSTSRRPEPPIMCSLLCNSPRKWPCHTF